MSTRVVNLRVDPHYDHYIGRAGKGKDGYFGNPFVCQVVCEGCARVHQHPADTLACYKRWFLRRVRVDEEFRERVHSLQGWTLGCFCKPRACHGDVIAEYVDALTHAELSGVDGAPERRSGVDRRARRVDVTALEHVRAQRVLARETQFPRGAVYCVGDEKYEVYRVTGREVVLRSTTRRLGFIMTSVSGPLDPSRWRRR